MILCASKDAWTTDPFTREKFDVLKDVVQVGFKKARDEDNQDDEDSDVEDADEEDGDSYYGDERDDHNVQEGNQLSELLVHKFLVKHRRLWIIGPPGDCLSFRERTLDRMRLT